MNPSYCRIKLPRKAALERFYTWVGRQPKESIETTLSNAVDVSCENGLWKGGCLYCYENKGWTVFEDLSGFLAMDSGAAWLPFAGENPLVVAGYNDAIPYGELVVIEDGQVLRDFMDFPDHPEEDRNAGRLPNEDENPLESWVGVAGFVDEDSLCFSEEGTVLIF